MPAGDLHSRFPMIKYEHLVCQEKATLYTEHTVIWNRAEVEHREEEEEEEEGWEIGGKKSKQTSQIYLAISGARKSWMISNKTKPISCELAV